jgi:hypothetical protein
MNLGTLNAWGTKTLAVLDDPDPRVLRYGTLGRLEQKLGWQRQFREPLRAWTEMERAIDVTVDFVRTHGQYRGAAKDLRRRLGRLRVSHGARDPGNNLAKFVAHQAQQLPLGERQPGCREGIETCFGTSSSRWSANKPKEDLRASCWR